MRRTVLAIAMVLAATILLGGVAAQPGMTVAAEAGEATIANPWVEIDAAGVEEALGLRFGIPEGAESIEYSLNESQELAEMRFVWDGLDYIARAGHAAEFEDISGLYYEPWDIEEPCQVGECEGLAKRTAADGETIDVCLWFDAEAGVMYAVSTHAADLDGFDIQAAAEWIYGLAQADEAE